ncbi:hypothetical protein E2C01_042092 [Portunus trituberculatus]|uniref:Uncharacterized protein n=1 Tax=Portunus trituberculatus TaxID=210409 RepID=A0A5B7FVI1_PORTR|nr:hypothetical protein [Portunus trituberculatus]
MPRLFSDLPNTSSLIQNVQIFQNPTTLETSGIWPKTSPIILLLHLFLFYFILIAPLPLHLSLKLNFYLKLLLITLPWMILGLSLLLLLPLTISCLELIFFIMMFPVPSLG